MDVAETSSTGHGSLEGCVTDIYSRAAFISRKARRLFLSCRSARRVSKYRKCVFYNRIRCFRAAAEEDPYRRILCIVKFYLSGFYKKPRGLKKPYNPILGETFRCSWHHPDGSITYYVCCYNCSIVHTYNDRLPNKYRIIHRYRRYLSRIVVPDSIYRVQYLQRVNSMAIHCRQ